MKSTFYFLSKKNNQININKKKYIHKNYITISTKRNRETKPNPKPKPLLKAPKIPKKDKIPKPKPLSDSLLYL